jgi:hypothetical protein
MADADVPALTEAEQDLVDAYLRVVDLVARLNPARDSGHFSAHGCVNAAQALVAAARDVLRAAETMVERGETELHAPTLATAVAALDGERRTARVVLHAPAHDPDAPPAGGRGGT